MAKNLPLITKIAVVFCILVAAYSWQTDRIELAKVRSKLLLASTEIKNLNEDLKSNREQVSTLKSQNTKDEEQIVILSAKADAKAHLLQKLEQDLNEQAKRVEQKRQAYQTFLAAPPNTELDTEAKIQRLKGEIQAQEQRDRLVQQDLANTNLDAQQARRKLAAEYAYKFSALASRTASLNQIIAGLKGQRADLPRDPKYLAVQQTRHNLDQQISGAVENLNLIRQEREKLQTEQIQQRQILDNMISNRINGLMSEKTETNHNLGIELAKTQAQSVTASNLQRERRDTAKKLAAELEEEKLRLESIKAKIQLGQ